MTGMSTMSVPVYLSEISVTAVRGRITLLYYFLYGIGFLAGTLVGGGFATVPKGWRYCTDTPLHHTLAVPSATLIYLLSTLDLSHIDPLPPVSFHE